MTTNKHDPQPQSSSGVTALAAVSASFGVLSFIASITIWPQFFVGLLSGFGYLLGLPLIGAAILPGAIAALRPGASTRTRIVAFIGFALAVLSIILWVSLGSAVCQQYPGGCE